MGSGPRRALIALALAALVVGGTWVRMAVALRDPGFDREQPVGMLKSDPALLYYVTERIVEADGWLPDDLRHDARVEHPRGADLAAEFTLGQEMLVAWTYPRLAFGAPLHVHAQRVMALVASCFVVGVYLVARALSGRAAPALLAAALAALLPACYRTIGFVLIREDLSLPLFALGAGCAAAAARAPDAHGRRGAAWGLGAGLALAAAAATWHAMAFVLALFALALALGYVGSGGNALASARGRLALVPLVAAAVLVPALRASGFLFSPPLILAAALLACGALDRRAVARGLPLRGLGRAVRLVGLAVAGGALAFGAARLGWSGQREMGHVYEVVLAKIASLGVPPTDPHRISFDARLLWQGPFETLQLRWGMQQLGLAVVPFALWLALVRRRAWSGVAGALVAFVALSLPAAWLIGRLLVLPAFALAAGAGPAFDLLLSARRRVAAGGLAALFGLQALLLASFASSHVISWYLPRGVAPELRALVAAVDEHVPASEAICADFVNSTALLAHTRRPIVLQPKYETAASRRDAEAFLTTFFHEPPNALRDLLRERFHCRYLLVDRYVLGRLSPWTAGLPDGVEPAPGTAAALFLSQDPAVLRSVAGFELVYRSPATILQSNGEPYDLYRLYRLVGK